MRGQAMAPTDTATGAVQTLHRCCNTYRCCNRCRCCYRHTCKKCADTAAATHDVLCAQLRRAVESARHLPAALVLCLLARLEDVFVWQPHQRRRSVRVQRVAAHTRCRLVLVQHERVEPGHAIQAGAVAVFGARARPAGQRRERRHSGRPVKHAKGSGKPGRQHHRGARLSFAVRVCVCVCMPCAGG
eukprot:365143-Chlamydomonas_euryale.AAC.7